MRRIRIAKGFTLIEIIVVIAILGIMLVSLAFTLNPFAQLQKANDATRKHDLEQIKNALDTYYNDHSCYPTTLPFSGTWSEGGTTYMTKVPQDSSCKSDPDDCYVYETDTTSACPQWNVLFAKQQRPATDNCQLKSISSTCVPPGYDTSWACSLSGTVDCSYISSQSVFTVGGTPPPVVPTTEPTTTSVPTSTPIPTDSCPQSQRNYNCSSGQFAVCNRVADGTGAYCAADCNGAC